MGPTITALLRLHRADQALRDATERLDSITREVRLQEQRNAAAAAKLLAGQNRLKDLQAKSAAFDLDLRARDEHIEKLRARQMLVENNKEFQAILVEINTNKVDRAKTEEQAIRVMEQVEVLSAEVRQQSGAMVDNEARLADLQSKVGDKAIAAQVEVDRLRPERLTASSVLLPAIVEAFDKLADRYEGSAMAAIEKPSAREEEYLCTGCNMQLVPDVYNKLKVRDDVVTCPTCRRMLYIPESMTSETVVTKKTRGKSERTVKKITKIHTEVSVPESKWSAIVSAAQGESARDSAEADQKPVECRVEINGEFVGNYKGKSPEHLERVIRFRLEETKMSAEVKVSALVPAAVPAVAQASPAPSAASTDTPMPPTQPSGVPAEASEAPAEASNAPAEASDDVTHASTPQPV